MYYRAYGYEDSKGKGTIWRGRGGMDIYKRYIRSKEHHGLWSRQSLSSDRLMKGMAKREGILQVRCSWTKVMN